MAALEWISSDGVSGMGEAPTATERDKSNPF
jgi:hypothetical protein